ncbi:MAG: cobalamin-dependent protein [Proteobacteria bacterium]|nr:cobalamin-dependent protein [Pseudomonadota bacterium]
MELTTMSEAMLACDQAAVLQQVELALRQKVPAQEIILQGLSKGMDRVGERFASRQYFVPDMLRASKIFNQAVAMVRPHLASDQGEPIARCALGLAKGCTQDNGKNIVRIMLEANQIQVADLGKSVSVEQFLAQARAGVDCIGVSVMTSSGITQTAKMVEALEEAGLRSQVKIMVGGAAVDRESALNQIKADAYGQDAGQAVKIVQEWFGPKPAS